MKTRRISNRRAASQAGQAFLLIVMMVSLFLLGVLGLATDYTQIWAKRQMAQAAADAACQAGAGDIFMAYAKPTLFTNSWIGTTYNCSSNTTSSPCVYAAANGYSGSAVSVSFPASVAGITLPSSSFGTIANPLIKVSVTDPVEMSFTKLVSSTSTVNISASAVCGLQPVSVPVPLAVLHPSDPSSFSVQGNPTITIYGGPTRSIQVDSSSSTAANAGGSSVVDLTQGGPNGTGGDFGVAGTETQPSQVLLGSGKWISPAFPYGDPWITVSEPTAPATAGAVSLVAFTTDGCPDPSGCAEFSPGDYTGCYSGNGHLPSGNGGKGCLIIPLPYNLPGFGCSTYPHWNNSFQYTVGTVACPSAHNSGNYIFQVYQCLGTVGTSSYCLSGSGGGPNPWTQTINTSTTGTCDAAAQQADNNVVWCNLGTYSATNTAIFKPGLYYLDSNGFQLNSNSTVRPAYVSSDATIRGATFYFSSSGTISVSSNSGKARACTSATDSGCVVNYMPNGTALYGVTSPALACPGGTLPSSSFFDPTVAITGNILFGPCSLTAGGTMLGSSDGKNRGFLFFQNRSNAVNASWGGGGQFLLAGFMYFHNSSYGSSLTLSGNSGAGAYALGNIVSDKIILGGTSGIKMILNAAITYQILRPELLQ